MWGFERVILGADKGAYRHPNFVRDQESLCNKMVRQKIKGKRTIVQSTSAHSEKSQPNTSMRNHMEQCPARTSQLDVDQVSPVVARSCGTADFSEAREPTEWQRSMKMFDNSEHDNNEILEIFFESSLSPHPASNQINSLTRELLNLKNKLPVDDDMTGNSSCAESFLDEHVILRGLAGKRRRSSLRAIFFDSEYNNGSGIDKSEFDTAAFLPTGEFGLAKRGSVRSRRSSMHTISLGNDGANRADGEYFDLSHFEGRKFYIVHDYNLATRST